MWISKAQWETAKADALRASDLAIQLSSERLAGCNLRVELMRAQDLARQLDARLESTRMHIAYLEAELTKAAKASWRWSMSTSKGDAGASND